MRQFFLKAIAATVLTTFLATHVSADLVGYWPLDGNAMDMSGNELHGELVGDIVFSEDVSPALGAGESLILNAEFVADGGVSQEEIIAEDNAGYVDLGNPDILNFSDNDWTISAWMKVPDGLPQRGNIFSNGGDNGGGVRYVLGYLENGGQAIVLTTDDNVDKRQAQASQDEFVVDDEEWHHVVGLRQDLETRVYIDGELAGENFEIPEGYDLSETEQLPAYIGVGADSGSGSLEKFFQGWVDDVAVWNEALTEEQIATVMSGDFSQWITGGLLGDFDGSGVLDLADINTLAAAIRDNSADTKFDLNGDGRVGTADHENWVITQRGTWLGDANLDGEFNSGDFVAVFQAGKFETGATADWSEGDWNGDGQFNSGDFVVAFQDGGFELGPRAAVQSVPEPAGLVLLVLGGLAIMRRRR